MDDCPFCGIVDGDRRAHVVYEDDETLVFLDDDPATEGHTLVVPKAHVEDLLLADRATAAAVAATAQAVAGAMEHTFCPDGFSVFHTTGRLVGNVEHAHLHLLPRTVDDDVHLALERESLATDEGERVVDRIRDGS